MSYAYCNTPGILFIPLPSRCSAIGAGYVRRVTHDEIADVVSENLREVLGTLEPSSPCLRGDREVGSAIYVWGLLGSGPKGIDRNRRVSNALSPIFYLFLIPSGILYQRAQHLLVGDETAVG